MLRKSFGALLMCALIGGAFSGDGVAAPARKAVARRAAPRKPAPAATPTAGITATYAKLCENGGTGDAETCAALKAAVLAKLQGGAVQPAKPAAPQPKPGFGLTIQKAKGLFVKGDVTAVEPGSPADKLGLKVGDKLTQAGWKKFMGNNYFFMTQEDIQTWLKAEAGKQQRLYFERDGKTQNVEMVIDPSWANSAPTQTTQAAQTAKAPVGQQLFGGSMVSSAAPTSSGSGLDRVRTAAYGSTISFEQRLAVGQMIEIEVNAPDGSVAVPIMCFWDDGFMGSDHQRCLAPDTIDKSRAIYRFRAQKAGEIHVKVKGSKGATGTFAVITRGEQKGRGAEAIAALERAAGKLQIGESKTADQLPLKMAMRYDILAKGQRGEFTTRSEIGNGMGKTLFTLDPNGNLRWSMDGETGPVELEDDGTVICYFSNTRIAFKVGPDGMITRSGYARAQSLAEDKSFDMGGFVRTTISPFSPTSEAVVAELMKSGPARLETAKLARMAQWGAYAQLAAHSWAMDNGDGDPRIATYAWEVPGLILNGNLTVASQLGLPSGSTVRMIYRPEQGDIVSHHRDSDGTTYAQIVKRGPLGEMVESLQIGGKMTLQMTGPGRFSRIFDVPKKYVGGSELVTEISSSQIAQLTRNAQQQRAEAKANSGGGFFDVVGKMAQAAAIVSNDGLYRQTMIDSMNAGVPGLGSAVGAVSGGGGGNGGGGSASGFGVPGGAGSGTGGGASYAKKPNLAMGPQCPGFTMSNYRTVALNGGNDQQLFSLCGQAFELYHQYENAIAQGYGEADANKTYAAHSDSARVATDFYRTAR